MGALTGRQLLNSRPKGQGRALSNLLRDRGADVLEVPMLELVPCVSEESLSQKLSQIGENDWLVFTSANGVLAVEPHVDLKQYKIAVIGKKTAEALETRGVSASFIAKISNSEAFAEEFSTYLTANEIASVSLLLLRGRIANIVLPCDLKKVSGLSVLEEAVYDSVPTKVSVDEIHAISELDLLLFTSSQAVRNFVELTSDVSKVPVAVIGPRTAETVQECGLELAVVAKEASVESLVDAVSDYFEKKS